MVRVPLHAERKSSAERFENTFHLRLVRRGHQPMVVCRRVEKFFACRCLHYRYRSAYFRIIAGCRRPQRACYGKKIIRRISWRKWRSVARVQLRTYFRRNCQPLGRYTDAAKSVDVFRLSGLVQTFVPTLFVRDNDEMDVSVLHIDTRSVLSPARAARPHIPSGNFRHDANVRALLSAVRSHVRRIHAYPDGIETHPSHYGQHVQLCAAHCCLRNSHCCRAGHPLDTKTVVGGFGICRCLLGDEE